MSLRTLVPHDLGFLEKQMSFQVYEYISPLDIHAYTESQRSLSQEPLFQKRELACKAFTCQSQKIQGESSNVMNYFCFGDAPGRNRANDRRYSDESSNDVAAGS